MDIQRSNHDLWQERTQIGSDRRVATYVARGVQFSKLMPAKGIVVVIGTKVSNVFAAVFGQFFIIISLSSGFVLRCTVLGESISLHRRSFLFH